jgi:hypothetical protein
VPAHPSGSLLVMPRLQPSSDAGHTHWTPRSVHHEAIGLHSLGAIPHAITSARMRRCAARSGAKPAYSTPMDPTPAHPSPAVRSGAEDGRGWAGCTHPSGRPEVAGRAAPLAGHVGLGMGSTWLPLARVQATVCLWNGGEVSGAPLQRRPWYTHVREPQKYGENDFLLIPYT